MDCVDEVETLLQLGLKFNTSSALFLDETVVGDCVSGLVTLFVIFRC